MGLRGRPAARAAFLVVALGVLAPAARAHVGSPDTFFAGAAGPYAVRVTVRPPGVVPGLAEIFVRVEGGGARSVSVRPMRTETGPSGAPPPDEAKPVAGEPGLYSASLWLMTGGAYAIEVAVTGDRGSGRTVVPVASLATRQLPMGPALVAVVIFFALLLVVGALAIVFAAASQATLAPGESPGPDRRRRAGIATAAAGVAILLLLWGERAWSLSIAERARAQLFRPYAMTAAAQAGPSGRVLRLSIDDPRWGVEKRGWRPLVPDHGKLVHLFAVKEPAFDAFAHLHPNPVSDRAFEAAFPPLPAGEYSLFADVTDETGISQTLVGRAVIPPPRDAAPRHSETTTLSDPDDSWRLAPPLPPAAAAPEPSALAGGGTMTWEGKDALGPVVAGRPLELAFAVRDAAGRPADLQPYMGMLGHAAVLRADGSVFVHLHPMGTVSMAALDAASKAARGTSPMAGMAPDTPASDKAGRVSFPYAFPKPGPYRLWVQVKTGGEVRTGVFDVLVR